MRKNWTKNEDSVLKRIVTEVGLNDWTAVANELKQKTQQIDRTGKQCRERWYNHLDPNVNKQTWSYQQQLMLFQYHKQLGNKWKEMSLRLKGRTDNNIKNHFYSTLRRSLRRLNKIIGEKNSTLHMRQIKPSVLTIILNFIYDHQDSTNKDHKQFINQLKDLPKLIFQFAQFKPVKGNMNSSLKDKNKDKIQTILGLIEQFKQSYYNEKNDTKRQLNQESDVSNNEIQNQTPLKSQFRPLQKRVNILVGFSNCKQQDNLNLSQFKWQSNSKQRSLNQKDASDNNEKMMQLDQPSPLTYINQQNPFPQLVVIGKHWCPKIQEIQIQQIDIDEILEMNYE